MTAVVPMASAICAIIGTSPARATSHSATRTACPATHRHLATYKVGRIGSSAAKTDMPRANCSASSVRRPTDKPVLKATVSSNSPALATISTSQFRVKAPWK